MWPLCKQCSTLRSFNAFVLVCNKSRFYPKWCISCLHSAQLICLWGPAPTRPIATEARRTLRNIFAAWIHQRHRVNSLFLSFKWFKYIFYLNPQWKTDACLLLSFVFCTHCPTPRPRPHQIQNMERTNPKDTHNTQAILCVAYHVGWCSTQMRNLTFLFVIRVTILIVLFGSGRPALL